ncbi:MAG TPA: transmembrane anchor protein, partial [Alphaproteobacteria bacterium]|nr:transmembrane anchor protein [Alphaproteobacteria bacterium]
MYNTDMPTRAELPTTPQLLRSTAIAIATAAVILVTVVLPSEYAIDPTGVG